MAFKKITNKAHRMGWLIRRMRQMQEFEESAKSLRQEIEEDLKTYGPCNELNYDPKTLHLKEE